MRIATLSLAMLLTVSTLAVSNSWAQNGPPRAVLTEQDAYASMPPELIAAPVVTQLLLSSNQRYAIALRSSMKITQQMLAKLPEMRTEPAGEVSLILWDSQ